VPARDRQQHAIPSAPRCDREATACIARHDSHLESGCQPAQLMLGFHGRERCAGYEPPLASGFVDDPVLAAETHRQVGRARHRQPPRLFHDRRDGSLSSEGGGVCTGQDLGLGLGRWLVLTCDCAVQRSSPSRRGRRCTASRMLLKRHLDELRGWLSDMGNSVVVVRDSVVAEVHAHLPDAWNDLCRTLQISTSTMASTSRTHRLLVGLE
jgi:hypothetical protein